MFSSMFSLAGYEYMQFQMVFYWLDDIINKTDVGRRQTLGHPKSINPNMINHVPQQSPLIF